MFTEKRINTESLESITVFLLIKIILIMYFHPTVKSNFIEFLNNDTHFHFPHKNLTHDNLNIIKCSNPIEKLLLLICN